MSGALPALSILFAVLATAVPWGLPPDATFILPLIVVMMVFCWRTIPDAVLHPATAMLLGLLTDVMSGGPLGFFGLLALIAAIVGERVRGLGEGRRVRPLWLFWMAFVAALALFGWLLASLFYVRWIDPKPIVFGAFASILLFPVVLRGVDWIRHGNQFRALIFRGRA